MPVVMDSRSYSMHHNAVSLKLHWCQSVCLAGPAFGAHGNTCYGNTGADQLGCRQALYIYEKDSDLADEEVSSCCKNY